MIIFLIRGEKQIYEYYLNLNFRFPIRTIEERMNRKENSRRRDTILLFA